MKHVCVELDMSTDDLFIYKLWIVTDGFFFKQSAEPSGVSIFSSVCHTAQFVSVCRLCCDVITCGWKPISLLTLEVEDERAGRGGGGVGEKSKKKKERWMEGGSVARWTPLRSHPCHTEYNDAQTGSQQAQASEKDKLWPLNKEAITY